jgi:hypothetical protein
VLGRPVATMATAITVIIKSFFIGSSFFSTT